MHVVHDLLLKPAHVLLELVDDAAELAVLALEQLDLVLEPGDALELAPSALGRGHAVPLPLPLQLDLLLVLHVDRRHRRRARDARHRLRLVLDVHQAGVAHGGLGALHAAGRLEGRVRGAVHAAGLLRAVGVVELVERVDEAARVQLLGLGDRLGEQDLGGRGGQAGDQAVRLRHDQLLELRRGQLQHVEVRRAQDRRDVVQGGRQRAQPRPLRLRPRPLAAVQIEREVPLQLAHAVLATVHRAVDARVLVERLLHRQAAHHRCRRTG